jgi:hypothetical protein
VHVSETGPAVAVTVAVADEDPTTAVSVTGWEFVRELVPAVNVAVVALAATVTVAGTASTAGTLSDSATTVPPEGAAFESVTVHDVLALEATVVGTHCSDVTRIGASKEIVAVVDVPLREAETVADSLFL